jgi:transcription elongation GreA/GreB family factor
MDRRSLLGRLVKAFPEMAKLVREGMDRARSSPEGRSEAAKGPEARLIVSWASLEQKKRELDEMVNKKIPANTKDIAVARSYGDLSENAEFKFAKEQQRVLSRMRSVMERELLLANGTDFKGADTSRAGIGTIVTVREGERRQKFTILGAWDTDPAKGIVSYLTPVARALNQRPVGERVAIPGDSLGTLREVVIESIEAFNP